MGSRLTRNGMDKVYAAALRWIHHALQSDGSLFTPGAEIWSRELLEQVRRNVLDKPAAGATFLEKLRRQLTGSPPEAYQLIAETLYIHYIGRTNVNCATKANNINLALGWSARPTEIPANLIKPLACGIANFFAGPAIPSYVTLLIEFAEQWKDENANSRDEMLKDPWAFKNFATGLEFQSALLKVKDRTPNMQREALLHLIHPDTFEAIFNVAHKENIARAFPDAVKDANADVDRKLQQIRANLEQQIGAHDHLFDKPIIRGYWDDKASNCLP